MIACAQPNDRGIPHDLLSYFDRVYWNKKIGRSQQTRKLYLLTLTKMGAFLGRLPTLDDLNDDTCAAYLSHRFNESAFAANKDRKNLSALATFAAKKRHIEQWVMMPEVPVVIPPPVALRAEQITDLLSACRRSPGMIGGVRASLWWRAFVIVALVTGERTSALLSIRRDWIGSDNWLRIPATVRKGRRKAMAYMLPACAVEAMRPLLVGDSPMLFPREFTDSAFYRRWGQLMELAGLPSGRRWKPQVLRRTFASWLKKEGGDATVALAHDSSKTTNQSYLDPTVTTATQPGEVIAKALGL